MLAQADRKTLAQALDAVGCGVGKGDVTECVHVAATPAGMHLRTTDYELCADAQFTCDVSRVGACVVLHADLTAAVGALPDGQIQIEHEGGHLLLRAGRSKWS